MLQDKKYVILRNFNSEESLGFYNPSVTCGDTSLYTREARDSLLFAQNDVLLMEGDYAAG